MDDPADRTSPPAIDGPPQFAARAKTAPGDDRWFTIGQAWEFDDYGQQAFQVQIKMFPPAWNGEMLLVRLPDRSGNATEIE